MHMFQYHIHMRLCINCNLVISKEMQSANHMKYLNESQTIEWNKGPVNPNKIA